MSKRSLLLLVAVIALGATLQSHAAEAVAVGQPCTTPGTTRMSDDQRDMVACLGEGSGSFVWEQLSVEPQSVTVRATPLPILRTAEWYTAQRLLFRIDCSMLDERSGNAREAS